jgi:hypothetical protein
MTNIIAARFQTVDAADAAIRALESAGCPRTYIDSFYVSPPGMHAATPIGGDAHSDAGTRDAGAGAVTGAVAGGATGLALGTAAALAIPVAGPVIAVAAAGIGAYTGSLAGGVASTTDGQSSAPTDEHPVPHTGGPMVAVNVAPEKENEVITILRDAGGHDLERAVGRFEAGRWVDFDPVAPRQPLEAPTPSGEHPETTNAPRHPAGRT